MGQRWMVHWALLPGDAYWNHFFTRAEKVLSKARTEGKVGGMGDTLVRPQYPSLRWARRSESWQGFVGVSMRPMAQLARLWSSSQNFFIGSRKDVSPDGLSPGQYKDILKSQGQNSPSLASSLKPSSLPSTPVQFLDWSPLMALDLNPRGVYAPIHQAGTTLGRALIPHMAPAWVLLQKSLFASSYLTLP